MRRELDHHPGAGGEGELFLDFRQMPVLGHAVGADAFIALAKEIIHLRLAARAADPAQGIGDDAVGLIRPAFSSGMVGSKMLVG